MSSVFAIREHTIEASYIREFSRATSQVQDDTLVQHVKQYTPKDNLKPEKGDITIIGAHANGLPKEVYEPLWEELYHQAKSHGVRIRDIYIADAAWQGRSGILNKDKLGNDPSWFDYSRDILHMINTLRPPTPLIAVGHSFGGAALLNASLTSPRTFTSIILLDPVISRYASVPGDLSVSPAAMSIYRRDTWPSREAAAESFGRSPFYQSWDRRAFSLWLQHGLEPTPDGTFTLTTTKHQEVFTYLRPSWPAFDDEGKTVTNRDLVPDIEEGFAGDVNLVWPLYRPEPPSLLHRLPNVRPPVLYVFGGSSNLSPKSLRDEKVQSTGSGIGGSGGASKGRVKGVVSEKCGHMIPLEAPRFCAENAASWIKVWLDRWRTEQEEYSDWAKKPQEEKATISEEYKRYAGKPAKPGKAQAKL
ncbi:hypothetical protein V2G26_008985 [Clonostachys chloroleuca]